MKPWQTSRTLNASRSLAVTVVLMGTLVGSANAQTTGSVGVASLDFQGDMPEAAKELLKNRLLEGLKAAQLSVKEDAVGDEACDKPSCYRKLARSMDVSFLVNLTVKEDRKNYDFGLEIFNGFTGQSSGSMERRCQICGLTEAGDRMSLAASALAERLHTVVSEPSRIVIHTNPPGAMVTIDGEARGPAPIEVNLPAGKHKVALTHSGHHSMERDFTVVNGVDHALDLDLLRIPSDFPYKTAGWTGVGVGAGLIAGGLALLATHGNEVSCSEAEQDADGDCPEVLSTEFLGAGLLAAGAVSATLGGVWLYLGRDTAPETNETVTVGFVGFRGRL